MEQSTDGKGETGDSTPLTEVPRRLRLGNGTKGWDSISPSSRWDGAVGTLASNGRIGSSRTGWGCVAITASWEGFSEQAAGVEAGVFSMGSTNASGRGDCGGRDGDRECRAALSLIGRLVSGAASTGERGGEVGAGNVWARQCCGRASCSGGAR